MSVYDLPSLNAGLNTLATVLLIVGYVFIRRGNVTAHRAAMLAAFLVSVLFLVSYLIYHYHVGSVRFPGTGAIRVVYLAILVTHIILAAIVPPLALLTLARGLRGDVDRHRRVARWTLPIWLYVSITGVIVYVMLYVIYAAR
jgi:uncharacterized membrane protein YozB (DUF420 family)